MSAQDNLQAFREREQGERFERHLRDAADTRPSREALRLEVDEAFERNGARRDLAVARAMKTKAGRHGSAPT
jgi:hypothetical protein